VISEQIDVPYQRVKYWAYQQPYRQRANNRYTIQDRKRAIELYEAGWSMSRVEKMMGVNRNTLRGWLLKAGIDRRSSTSYRGQWSRRSPEFIERVIALYEEGLTTGEIGKIVGRHQTSISKLLRDSGIRVRTAAESLVLANTIRRNRDSDSLDNGLAIC
jgi:transposase